MPIVVAIRFKDSGKIYYFDPNGLEALRQGDQVIVETVRGFELAKVAYPPHEITPEEVVGELKPVVRRAESSDFERMRLLNARHDEVMARCIEKINEHNLPMRLIKAEYSFDGSRLTFYFTAEKRVDFRMLVRDLARAFRTRIELRQIGPRDEAKLLGGIGPCGRLLCCATFLPDYARVSIKMAKDQDLPLNPTKISGVCGRLLCCLSYEHDQYLAIKAELPKRGAWVQTPDGPGEVVAVNVVRETVIVELAGSNVHEEFSPSQISEAIRRVGDVARSRAEAGITPAGRRDRRESTAEAPPRREPKHTGERRLLREEINDIEVLDALALLEEGIDDQEANVDHPPSAAPAESRETPQARPPEQRRQRDTAPLRRPRPAHPPTREDGTPGAQRRAEPQPARHQQRFPAPQSGEQGPAAPPAQPAGESRGRRRRRGPRGER